ncbi:uncharacterized protein Eig71Eg [Drosophila takahashii]|uniref:uncharacterized protein Eig71Eg n=1 Tax=Drosophila takahashii TaxID=29030 RepID=UPI001CF8D458|nr:uncharacterized protein LOC108057891 [Drosophila takahashii]
MSKLLVVFAFCCILVTQILAQDSSGRRFCDRLYDDCRREEATVGTQDDTVGFFNAYCGRHDRNWKKLTRCQLVRASCILTMVRCDNGSCKNVAESLRP